MSKTKRTARELALQTLFQVDVGKQSPDSVLDEGLELLRHNLTSIISRIARNAGAELLKQPASPSNPASITTKRQIRSIARALLGEVSKLSERTEDAVRNAVSPNGHFDTDTLLNDFDRYATDFRRGIQAQASKSVLSASQLDRLEEVALNTIPAMRQELERHAESMIEAGNYTITLVHGVMDHREDIDRHVTDLSSGWSLDRQAAVDRNILRLAVYELMFGDYLPVGVVINEAVELAKKYSTEESGRFVNGVLGALAQTHQRASDEL